MKHHLKFMIAGLLCLFLLAAGCDKDKAGYTVVDFNKHLKVDGTKEITPDPATLNVAVGAMISPKETLASYHDILNYIGRHLGFKIRLVQRDTYAEVNELLSDGQVDIAFTCSGPYASGKDKYGFEGLVTPVMNGKPFYQAYLIVRTDSPYQSLSDLKGHTFAFTDPDSNTGALVPTYWLSKIGQTPDSFFSAIIFTHSHDNSIMAVAKSMVDGACVGSPFWEYFQARDPVYTSQTRIIKKSEWFGGPPLVASKHVSRHLQEKIRQLLVAMNKDPQGLNIIKKLGIDAFRPTEDTWYDSVVKMQNDINAAGIKDNNVEKH